MTTPSKKLIEVAPSPPGPASARSLADLAQEEDRFFSNAGKRHRERWVLEHWLAQSGKSHLPPIEGEGPDFTVACACVEIVEVLEPDRRRQADAKADAVELRAGRYPPPRLAPDLDLVKNRGCDWILQQIHAKAAKYGATAAAWTLVVYVNVTWADRIDWVAVQQELGTRPPPFRQIDALSPDGQSVITLFRRE